MSTGTKKIQTEASRKEGSLDSRSPVRRACRTYRLMGTLLFLLTLLAFSGTNGFAVEYQTSDNQTFPSFLEALTHAQQMGSTDVKVTWNDTITVTPEATDDDPDPEPVVQNVPRSVDASAYNGQIYASAVSLFFMNNYMKVQSLFEQLRNVPLVSYSGAAAPAAAPGGANYGSAGYGGYGMDYGTGYGGYGTGGMDSAPYGPGYAPVYGDPSFGSYNRPMESGIFRGQSQYGDAGTLIYSAFLSGMIGGGKMSERSSALGYDTENRGVLVGLDLFGCTDCRSGLYYSYEQNKIKGAPAAFGDLKSKEHMLGWYHYFGDEAVYNIATIYGGYNKQEVVRSVTGDISDNFSSKGDNYSGGANIERGAHFNLGDAFTISPYGGLGYLFYHRGEATESSTNNTGTALAINKKNYNSLRSTLGLRTSLNMYPGNQIVKIVLHGNWSHEFLDDIWGTSTMKYTGLLGNNEFSVSGNTLGRDWGLIGIGGEWIPVAPLVLYINYDFIKNKYVEQSFGYAGLKWRW